MSDFITAKGLIEKRISRLKSDISAAKEEILERGKYTQELEKGIADGTKSLTQLEADLAKVSEPEKKTVVGSKWRLKSDTFDVIRFVGDDISNNLSEVLSFIGDVAIYGAMNYGDYLVKVGERAQAFTHDEMNTFFEPACAPKTGQDGK